MKKQLLIHLHYFRRWWFQDEDNTLDKLKAEEYLKKWHDVGLDRTKNRVSGLEIRIKRKHKRITLW